MKAVTYSKYGPPEVLQLEEVAKPAPKSNEVLIKIHATTVSAGDVIMRSFNIPGSGFEKLLSRFYLGFNKPKRTILGMEIAGEVETVGEKVKLFKKGDQVFASTVPKLTFGGYAEYQCLPENGIISLKPANMTYEEAAPVAGGAMTALVVLRKAKVWRGTTEGNGKKKVLIYGASGNVGSYAIQIARSFGTEVTGVCSTSNLEIIKSLGADKVIDYTREDFTQNGETYHVIFDAVDKLPASKCNRSLKQSGVYLNVRTSSGRPGDLMQRDLVFLKDLCEGGQLKTLIDRSYSLDQIVEAHRYVEKGHKKGSVVIKMT